MKINYFVLPILLFLFCFLGSIYLSTIPAKDLTTLNWLKIPYLDKIIHIGIFFTLCFTFSFALNPLYSKKISAPILIAIVLLFVSYGTGVEFYQENYVEGRSFEIADIAADAFGCLLFVAWYKYGSILKKSWSR